jgi:hypothetical protein
MKYKIGIAISVVVVLGLFGLRHISQAQQEQDSSYQAITDKFFSLLKEDKASEAIDYIFGTNPAISKGSPDEIDQMKTQFASLRKVVGPYISHAKLVETKVAGMYVYQHYFVAYQRQPISIRIRYYKPSGSWVCHGLHYDSHLDDLIVKLADQKLSSELK